MEIKRLVSWTKFYSNNKKQWFMQAHVIAKASSYDVEHGLVGSEKVEIVFVPDTLWKLFEDAGTSLNGKDLEFHYAISGRFVNLVDIVPVK